MTFNLAAYLVGCTCLACAFGLAGEVIFQELRQWRRIWSTLLGRHLVPDDRPLPLAATSGSPSTPAHDAGCAGARTRRA